MTCERELIKRLRKALKRYGQHDMLCPVSAGAAESECACGLARAVADTESERAP